MFLGWKVGRRGTPTVHIELWWGPVAMGHLARRKSHPKMGPIGRRVHRSVHSNRSKSIKRIMRIRRRGTGPRILSPIVNTRNTEVLGTLHSGDYLGIWGGVN